MNRIHSFDYFARGRLGRKPSSDEEIIDTCLQGMQENILDVCVQNIHKCNLWTSYGMTAPCMRLAGTSRGCEQHNMEINISLPDIMNSCTCGQTCKLSKGF